MSSCTISHVVDDFNNAYLATQATRLGGRVLDFGCGRAHTVRLLRKQGVDAYGTDIFFDGMDWMASGPHDLVEAGTVREIADGVLPFEDATFDTIVSDQVIEHVEDLETAISEMSRVLRADGRMYHQYPTLEVIREAHTNVPWAHRLPPSARVPYLRIARIARLSRVDPDRPEPLAYARHMSSWIDEYCRYRSRETIEANFARHGFRVAHRELDYCRSRAEGHPLVSAAVATAPALASGAFRRLGFDCVEVARVSLRSAAVVGDRS
jgi:SAM-dependent methyltransferase